MNQDAFEVIGGKQLQGEITPQGAKNEALQVLCAVLLTPEKVTISNLPAIRDVLMLIELLSGLGVRVEKLAADTYTFQAENIDLDYLYHEDFRNRANRIRGSVMFIGPLLARYGKAVLHKPGGDKIGRRRLDTHLLGLEMLGANFDYNEEKHYYDAKTSRLQGKYILMDEISVTGTANVVMGAVLAEGKTELYNAASDAHVQQ